MVTLACVVTISTEALFSLEKFCKQCCSQKNSNKI